MTEKQLQDMKVALIKDLTQFDERLNTIQRMDIADKVGIDIRTYRAYVDGNISNIYTAQAVIKHQMSALKVRNYKPSFLKVKG